MLYSHTTSEHKLVQLLNRHLHYMYVCITNSVLFYHVSRHVQEMLVRMYRPIYTTIYVHNYFQQL